MAERFGGGGGRGGSGSGGKKPYVRRDAAGGSSSGPRKPYAPRGDKPAYASRGDRPYTPRGDKPAFGERKPYVRRDASATGDRPAFGERKPYTPREGGERKPYAPRGDRPYTPRESGPRADGERRPYTPRGDKPAFGERKPYVRRDASATGDRPAFGDRKPYTPREGGERKPYAPRGDRPYTPRADGERRPYTPRDGAPRGDRPAFGERKPYTPREGGERKPYAPRGDRPYTPRGDRPAFGERKPGVSQRDQSLQEHSGFTGDGKPARFDARRESARRPRPQNVSDKKPWREQRENIVRDPAGGDGWLVGVHPVLAALTAGRRAVRELWLLAEPKAALADLIAANPQWLVLTKTRPDFDAQFGEEVAHQGVALLAGNLPQPSLPDVLSRKPTLLVALDQVTDPHNVGAIVRSAGAFGAAAVLHTEHRSAGLTPVVAKVAAGTLEVVPLVEIVNLVQSLELLKEAGFTVIGLAGEAEHSTLQDVLPKLTGPVCMVLGSEGDGLRRLTRETCDFLVRLPISPLVESLNVSVAAGITLHTLSSR